jgi:hypothetical protein
MSAIQISSSAEFLQVNTTTNAGTILLPSTIGVAGRILTIKDTAGTFFTRPLTLSTNGADRFENGANLRVLREPFGYLTLASDGAGRWFNLDGTSLPSYAMLALRNNIGMSTTTISSSQFSVSTLGIIDRSFQTQSTLYSRSTLLFLGSNVIAGSKAGPNIFLPVRRPFNPTQISGLRFWFDAADTNTIQSLGSRLILLRNKGTDVGTNLFVNAGIPTTGVQRQNGLNLIGLANGVSLNFIAATPNANRTRFVATQILTNTTSGQIDFLYQNNSSTSGNDFIAIQGQTLLQIAQGVVVNLQTATVANQQNFFRVLTFLNGTTAQNRVAITGTPQTLTTSSNAGSYNTVTASNFINIISGSTQNLGEWIYYDSALTTAQAQQVEGYLAWKWGVTNDLPINHPFKNIPP